MAKLFTPITLGPHTYANRIAISPMAQYSAENGSMSDWHLIHLGALATSGAGVVMIEATSVDSPGRCTLGDPGLYSDDNEAALVRVIETMRRYTPVKIGIQLSHGGRKASTALHWQGGQPILAAEGGWETLAPSALPFGTCPTPKAANEEDLERLVRSFADSARRAARAGIDLIELHAAHGYLLHQFMSPISNQRTDDFGGSLENRMRLPLRVFEAVRDAAPGVTLGVRLTASDWIDGGIVPDEAVAFAQELEAAGCHYVDVTSGGIDPRQKITVGPGYQVGFAQTVKQKTNLAVRAVGLIVTPEQAEEIVASGKADLVAIARAALANPRWPWEAAHILGAPIEIPPQYLRASSSAWPGWTILAPKEAAE